MWKNELIPSDCRRRTSEAGSEPSHSGQSGGTGPDGAVGSDKKPIWQRKCIAWCSLGERGGKQFREAGVTKKSQDKSTAKEFPEALDPPKATTSPKDGCNNRIIFGHKLPCAQGASKYNLYDYINCEERGPTSYDASNACSLKREKKELNDLKTIQADIINVQKITTACTKQNNGHEDHYRCYGSWSQYIRNQNPGPKCRLRWRQCVLQTLLVRERKGAKARLSAFDSDIMVVVALSAWLERREGRWEWGWKGGTGEIKARFSLWGFWLLEVTMPSTQLCAISQE